MLYAYCEGMPPAGTLSRMASNLDPFGDDEPATQPAITVRDLALAGYTDSEIAAATGRSVESVTNDPAVLVPLGDAHILRLERALYSRGVGGVTWEERLDKLGEVRRVESQLVPDVKAAVTVLERRAPDRWQDGRQEQLNVVIVRIEGQEGRRVTIDHDTQTLAPPLPTLDT